MNFPGNVKYTKNHEWISVQGNIGTVGITDYAQSELGDVVYVDIDSNLKEVKKGESFGTIEAVKTVSEIYAPCSGNVVEINKEFSENPEVINSDPYGFGWMIKIDIKDLNELSGLMNSEEYKLMVGK